MVEFKLVISDKGKSMQKEVKEAAAESLLGLKIGDKVDGNNIGLNGYEFEMTGGSDHCGFPMRKDVTGTKRKRILSISGTGLKVKRKGVRKRKTVCGNTVHEQISQINLNVTKAGSAPLAAEAKEGEAKEGEAKEAPKKEEKKEAPKAEAKKEEKPAEKKEAPKEALKGEEKKEEKKEAKPEEPKKE